MTQTLGELFPVQQARVREILGHYKEIGEPGRLGALLIEDVLQRADQAAMSGDVVEMVRVYHEMEDIK